MRARSHSDRLFAPRPDAADAVALSAAAGRGLSAAAVRQPRLDRTPMRIAFLTVSAAMGGSERSLVDLLRALRALRLDWRFDVVLPREGPLAVQVRDAGASAVFLPMPAALSQFGESGRGR